MPPPIELMADVARSSRKRGDGPPPLATCRLQYSGVTCHTCVRSLFTHVHVHGSQRCAAGRVLNLILWWTHRVCFPPHVFGHLKPSFGTPKGCLLTVQRGPTDSPLTVHRVSTDSTRGGRLTVHRVSTDSPKGAD